VVIAAADDDEDDREYTPSQSPNDVESLLHGKCWLLQFPSEKGAVVPSMAIAPPHQLKHCTRLSNCCSIMTQGEQ
jgi:hypothetical protein